MPKMINRWKKSPIKSACKLGTLLTCVACLVLFYYSSKLRLNKPFSVDSILGDRVAPQDNLIMTQRQKKVSQGSGRIDREQVIIDPRLKETHDTALKTSSFSPFSKSSSFKDLPTSSASPPPNSENKKNSLCPTIKLNPFDPVIMKYLEQYDPTDCSKGMPSLVYLDNGKLYVNTSKVNQTVGKISLCKYAALKLSEKNDSSLMTLTWSEPFLEKPIELMPDEEHLYVQCFFFGKLVGETFKSRVVEKPSIEKRRRADYQRHVENNSPVETMNVLILGIDGTSKQNFIRFMPKTRKFLLERLHAKELHKFNKVGDDTFENVIVFQTKRNISELLKQFSYEQYFDNIDCMFLWHKYQNAGYRTAMGFDTTSGTAFHNMKGGWKRPPFDFYSRPITLGFEFNGKRFRKGDHCCIGEVHELKILHDYLFQIASKFKNSRETPYFLYNFYTHITHDFQELAFRADPLYLSLFQRLENTNVLNNTIMVFFSDHGPRFGQARNTLNGKIEGNSPFVFFIFPPWFEEKYPELMKTFRTNQDRLTTFYDMHQTVLELLTFKGKSKVGSLDSVGISLFDEIPVERTCLEANIPLEYCNCLRLENGTVSKKIKQTLAQHLLHSIVETTTNERKICAILKLKSVHSVLVDATKTIGGGSSGRYQITIETTPGGALYEALMEYSADKHRPKVVGKIVRINFYDGQDSCQNKLELKPFCFCKS